MEERRGEAKKRERGKRRVEEEIRQEDINDEIKRMKKGKAAGIVGIRNVAWKAGGEEVAKRLGEIIKRLWEGEGFPDKWRVGVVVPIWKRGDKKLRENYRGVTLTSTGYKVYANILNKKLVKELDEKEGWSRTQAGFRKGRGTIENVKILKLIVGRKIKERKKV